MVVVPAHPWGPGVKLLANGRRVTLELQFQYALFSDDRSVICTEAKQNCISVIHLLTVGIMDAVGMQSSLHSTTVSGSKHGFPLLTASTSVIEPLLTHQQCKMV